MRSLSSYTVTMITCMAGKLFLISTTHWMPDMPGSLISISTTSGCFSAIMINASSAEAATPTQAMSGAISRILVICSRSPLSSSTTTTDFFIKNKSDCLWIGGNGQVQMNHGTGAGPAGDGATAADLLHAPFHVRQPVARLVVRQGKAAAVVLNGDIQLVIVPGKIHHYFGTAGMLDHIMNGFLDDHGDIVAYLAGHLNFVRQFRHIETAAERRALT